MTSDCVANRPLNPLRPRVPRRSDRGVSVFLSHLRSTTVPNGSEASRRVFGTRGAAPGRSPRSPASDVLASERPRLVRTRERPSANTRSVSLPSSGRAYTDASGRRYNRLALVVARSHVTELRPARGRHPSAEQNQLRAGTCHTTPRAPTRTPSTAERGRGDSERREALVDTSSPESAPPRSPASS